MDAIEIICPNCQEPLSVPDDAARVSCARCGQRIHVLAHVAYEWGQEMFLEARREAYERRVLPLGRARPWAELDEDVSLAYVRAYEAIREAFRSPLHETQRKAGIEIMAEITALFSAHMMTSPLEASYWRKLLTEQAGYDLYCELRNRVNARRGNPLGSLPRLWWRFRMRRLRHTLLELAKQLDALEEAIEFVDRPRTRVPRDLNL